MCSAILYVQSSHGMFDHSRDCRLCWHTEIWPILFVEIIIQDEMWHARVYHTECDNQDLLTSAKKD